MEKEINAFLEEKGHTRSKPTILQHYGDSFNAVDRLNKVRSYIAFRPRMSDEKFRILVSLVEMALIQSWLLVISWRGEVLNEEEHLHSAAKNLAKALYPKNE